MRIRAGFTIEKVLGDVQELLTGAQNAGVLGRGGYLEWVERAERKLRELFSNRDAIDSCTRGTTSASSKPTRTLTPASPACTVWWRPSWSPRSAPSSSAGSGYSTSSAHRKGHSHRSSGTA
jgi:hypothetical protein